MKDKTAIALRRIEAIQSRHLDLAPRQNLVPVEGEIVEGKRNPLLIPRRRPRAIIKNSITVNKPVTKNVTVSKPVTVTYNITNIHNVYHDSHNVSGRASRVVSAWTVLGLMVLGASFFTLSVGLWPFIVLFVIGCSLISLGGKS